MNEKFTLIIIGTLALSYGFVCALRLKESMRWATVRGFITKSQKRIEHTDAGKLEYADIAYDYVFGNKKYNSGIIKIGGDMLSDPSKNSLTEADILLKKFPPGKEVNVYVNPQHPKVACLERAGIEAVIISIFSGMLAVVVGLYFTEITSLIYKFLKFW